MIRNRADAFRFLHDRALTLDMTLTKEVEANVALPEHASHVMYVAAVQALSDLLEKEKSKLRATGAR